MAKEQNKVICYSLYNALHYKYNDSGTYIIHTLPFVVEIINRIKYSSLCYRKKRLFNKNE